MPFRRGGPPTNIGAAPHAQEGAPQPRNSKDLATAGTATALHRAAKPLQKNLAQKKDVGDLFRRAGFSYIQIYLE